MNKIENFNKKIINFFNHKILILLFKENKKINEKNFYKSKQIGETDPVTKHDVRIEKNLRRLINNFYPKHGIIGEEFSTKNTKSDYTWVIDPIDGTKALLAGQPTWSNLIGILYRGKALMGLANFPKLKKYYFSDGKNSYLISNKNKKKISTNKKMTLKKSYLVTNSIHTFKNYSVLKFLKNYKNMFKITGCDAYNFCLLAEGKIDLIIEAGLKKYDILPILPILKNSGAIITDWNGEQNFLDGNIVVAANINLHKSFLKLVKKNINIE
tara:strand:+ start:342 stop:1148 length:807 start_codon:yes stop_codon:yes gene_type:complete